MLQPRFLRCDSGHLHLMAWGHADWRTPAVDRVTLILPPFAEEMNKSRYMLARLGHRLGEAGGCALLPDLYGTGDSEGRFEDADWDIWRQDIRDVVRHLHAADIETIDIVALRMGAMLALSCLPESPLHIGQLLLWQPLLSGKRLIGQFLRLRVMTAKMKGRDESVKQLLARLADGETLEIGGYRLSPRLAGQLLKVQAEELPIPGGLHGGWIEVVGEAGREPSPAARKIVDRWLGAGCRFTIDTVEGPNFWETQEIATAPALLDETLQRLAPR